jgi:hypothetical protein
MTDTNKEKLKEFIIFVKKELDLKTTPKIRFQTTRKDLNTTASYNYMEEKKLIKIYVKNRALVDIMRSVAHEMTHHKQFEDGRLETKPPDIGHEIEDEANAKAGKFIKLFSKLDKTIYEL